MDARRLPRSLTLERIAALSREAREQVAIAAVTAASVVGRRPVSFSRRPFGPSTTERVVEVPWALSRYQGEARVLDVGYAHAPLVYRALVWRLRVPNLQGLDLVPGPAPHTAAVGDVRHLPYRTASIDLVLCISTLEHIGLDNRIYGSANESSPGDHEALREFKRVMAPGGRVLVTVPFGCREDHGWFRQYDLESWVELIRATGFAVEEQGAFRLGRRGWEPAAPDSLGHASYGDGSPAARAVLCSSLIHPT